MAHRSNDRMFWVNQEHFGRDNEEPSLVHTAHNNGNQKKEERKKFAKIALEEAPCGSDNEQ